MKYIDPIDPIKYILASGSPRRKDLLKNIIPTFEIIIPNVDEIETAETALFLPTDNAIIKGKKIAKQYPDCMVISADTIVVHNDTILGKPKNFNNAIEMLNQLNGQTHQVMTGVSLINISANYYQTFTETSTVTFNKLSEKEMKNYLSLINPLDKAGAYAAQEYSELLINNIAGSINNVIGLPTEALKEVLRKTQN